MTHTLECLSNQSESMFTPGKLYTVQNIENDRLYIVRDDRNRERAISKGTLNFITKNTWNFLYANNPGSVCRAYFKEHLYIP